jgi:hypothetical protein
VFTGHVLAKAEFLMNVVSFTKRDGIIWDTTPR